METAFKAFGSSTCGPPSGTTGADWNLSVAHALAVWMHRCGAERIGVEHVTVIIVPVRAGDKAVVLMTLSGGSAS